MDISTIKYFKIHPAIGVSRIANNEDYFEFFEAHSKNFTPAKDYMSGGGPNDPEPGKLRLKRQAVQFTVYAYDENDRVLGKVQDIIPGVRMAWSAEVGNRKLYNYSTKKGGTQIKPITAKAIAGGTGAVSLLNGVNPWDSTKTINLGTITGKGLYIPPKGGVTREKPGSAIASYPANANGNLECTDTSCDGQISVVLHDERGAPINKPVIAAWVIATPPQHALTLTPVVAQEMGDNFGSFIPNNANRNTNWIMSTKKLLGIQNPLYDPTGLDSLMMATLNGDYNPGMEVNLGNATDRIENGADPKKFFYPRGTNNINKDEIRVESKNGTNGAIPGQLTSGLCSTWQGDMMACLNYWTAENPNQAYGNNGQVQVVIYKEGDPGTTMNNPEEINKDMDFRGIVEYKKEGDDIRLNLVYDPNRR